jgi:hypothetical protein
MPSNWALAALAIAFAGWCAAMIVGAPLRAMRWVIGAPLPYAVAVEVVISAINALIIIQFLMIASPRVAAWPRPRRVKSVIATWAIMFVLGLTGLLLMRHR